MEINSLSKSEFMNLVISKMSPYYMILGLNGDSKIYSGDIPCVLIDSERRAGNKV